MPGALSMSSRISGSADMGLKVGDDPSIAHHTTKRTDLVVWCARSAWLSGDKALVSVSLRAYSGASKRD
jgi:hypothetical protein